MGGRRVLMSQMRRATRTSLSPHGNSWKVGQVGLKQHVRLLDPHEPLDRRAVEHDVAVERLLELRRRDSTFLFTPRMSVNCSRRNRTLFSRASASMSVFVAPVRSRTAERWDGTRSGIGNRESDFAV
jgi:hypothetical protein